MKINYEQAKETRRDARFVYNIRYSKEVIAVSQSDNIPDFEDHFNWFKDNFQQYRFIIIDNKRVGFLRKDSSNYLGISLKKCCRNKGIGKEVLKTSKGRAIILTSNPRSFHCFMRSGWKLEGFYVTKE